MTRIAVIAGTAEPTLRERWTAYYRLRRMVMRNPADTFGNEALLTLLPNDPESRSFVRCAASVEFPWMDFGYKFLDIRSKFRRAYMRRVNPELP